MNSFLIEQEAVVGERIFLSPQDSRHLTKVLRQTKQGQIRVSTPSCSFLAQILETDPVVEVELLELLAANPEAPLQVYLLQGMAKGERMDLIIQKTVELGVSAIVPIACSRCVVQLKGDKARAKTERWQKVAVAAAKQSGRQKIPQILPVASLQNALAQLPKDTVILMPWEEATQNDQGKDCSLKAALAGKPPQAVALVIGPEGGFTQEEVALAKQQQGQIVTLGERILRTETAAIAVVTILMYEWGDMGGYTFGRASGKSANEKF